MQSERSYDSLPNFTAADCKYLKAFHLRPCLEYDCLALSMIAFFSIEKRHWFQWQLSMLCQWLDYCVFLLNASNTFYLRPHVPALSIISFLHSNSWHDAFHCSPCCINILIMISFSNAYYTFHSRPCIIALSNISFFSGNF